MKEIIISVMKTVTIGQIAEARRETRRGSKRFKQITRNQFLFALHSANLVSFKNIEIMDNIIKEQNLLV